MMYFGEDPELIILWPKVFYDVLHMRLPQPVHHLQQTGNVLSTFERECNEAQRWPVKPLVHVQQPCASIIAMIQHLVGLPQPYRSGS